MGTVVLVPGGLCGLSEMYFSHFLFIVILELFVVSFWWRVPTANPLVISESSRAREKSNLARPRIRVRGGGAQASARPAVAACACGGPPESVVAAATLGGPGGCLRGAICIEPHDQHPRNLELSKSYPRHPRLNFTESRVRSGASPTGPVGVNCVEPPGQRARRPSVNWFPLRTSDLNFKRKPMLVRLQ